jgi:hypothetical protein
MSIKPDNPDIPDEYMLEIGRIVVNWNKLESLVLHVSVITLLGDFSKDGRALAVLTHMAFPQRLHALEAMLRIYDEDLAKTYCEKVKGLLTQSADKRNALLHQPWFSQDDGVKRLHIAARGTLKFNLLSVGIQELVDTAKFIEEAHSQLLSLIAFPIGVRITPQQGNS